MPTNTTPRPLQFSMDGNGGANRYGQYFWAIGLPDGREVFVMAETLEVLPNGAIRSVGKKGEPTLILPAGCWVHAYAASCMDSSPVAVDSLVAPK